MKISRFFCILLAEKLASQAAEKPLHNKKSRI